LNHTYGSPGRGNAEVMQSRPAFFVITALVVVGAVAGIDLMSAAADGSAYSFSPCSYSVRLQTNYVQSNGSLTTTAFLIAQGATAKVCITYSLDGAPVTLTAGPLACGPHRSADGSVAEGCPGDLTVVSSAPLRDGSDGANVTVAYVLRASENAGGVYWFWVDCGEVFPLAVGAPPSSLTFPIIPGCVYEPNAPSRGSVTGISDLGVAMVRVD